MIKSTKGKILISGNTSELIADLGCIVDVLHKELSEAYGSEEAKKMIVEAVEMGFETEEENDARLEKVKKQLAEKATKEMLNIILKGLV